MNRKTIISLLLFAAAVILLTKVDYLINAELYQFGLKFSDMWWQNYQILYNCLFQFTIGMLLLYSRNWRFAIVQEAFVLSCGQDLVYFGLWSGGVFPSGNWTWMSMYHLLGTWTTTMQITLSVTLTLAPILMFLGLRNRNLHMRFGSPFSLTYWRHKQQPILLDRLAIQPE